MTVSEFAWSCVQQLDLKSSVSGLCRRTAGHQLTPPGHGSGCEPRFSPWTPSPSASGRLEARGQGRANGTEHTDRHGSRTHLGGHPCKGSGTGWGALAPGGSRPAPQVLPSAAVPELLPLCCPLQAWALTSTWTRAVCGAGAVSMDSLFLLLTVGSLYLAQGWA